MSGWGLVVRRVLRASALFVVFSWVGSASAGESLYQTLPARPQSSFGSNTSFVFIAPYVTRVATTLSASISKAPTSGSGGSQASKATTPSVSYADFAKGQIRYWVACDLRTVLHPGDQVIVTGIQSPVYNTAVAVPSPPGGGAASSRPVPASVVSVSAGQVLVTPPDSWKPPGPNDVYKSGGMITGANLDTCPLSGDAFAVAMTIAATPQSRGYLYLHRNAFFDDNVNFTVGTDGMLADSDTSSTQEITAILTELAQTASAIATGSGSPLFVENVSLELPISDQDRKAIDQLKKDTAEEAAAYLNSLPTNDILRIFGEMQSDDLGAVLKGLSSPDLGALLKKLEDPVFAGVVLGLSPPDAFDVLRRLYQEDQGEILKNWPKARMTELAAKLTLRGLNDLLGRLSQADKDTVFRTFGSTFADINARALRDETKKLESQKRPVCFKAVADTVKTVPFYKTVAFDEAGGKIEGDDSSNVTFTPGAWPRGPAPRGITPKDSTITWTVPVSEADDGNRDAVSIRFTLKTRFDSYHQATGSGRQWRSFGGFVAFFPVPATARNECVVTHTVDQLLPTTMATVTKSFLLGPQTVVNLYTESHFLNPQRDFFTNPHDTFTFTAGMITGHKFTGQSAAKTVIDTITQPIRSLMPSVTVTQTVAVSPTGKTTTTATQTAPPK